MRLLDITTRITAILLVTREESIAIEKASRGQSPISIDGIVGHTIVRWCEIEWRNYDPSRDELEMVIDAIVAPVMVPAAAKEGEG